MAVLMARIVSRRRSNHTSSQSSAETPVTMAIYL
jgi:hypothetical protein